MLSFRRAVLLSLLLLFFIFFLYPRHPQTAFEPEQSPVARRPEDLKDIGRGRKPPTPAAVPKDAKEQQQLSISDLKKLPVIEQLAYQFPYQVSSKFPAYIWQTWKYTPANSEFEERFRITEASWTEKHPAFVHEVSDVCGSLGGLGGSGKLALTRFLGHYGHRSEASHRAPVFCSSASPRSIQFAPASHTQGRLLPLSYSPRPGRDLCRYRHSCSTTRTRLDLVEFQTEYHWTCNWD